MVFLCISVHSFAADLPPKLHELQVMSRRQTACDGTTVLITLLKDNYS